MLKIVHCADIHAGRPAPRELDEERASVRRREIETSFARIVDFTRKEKARLLLVSGDLFEHLYVRPAWAKEAAALLQSIPDTRVFISPGNHDPVVRGSLYRSIEWPPNVTVFDLPELREIPVEGTPVVVYGFGWTSYVEEQQVLKGFAARRSDSVNILVIHGDLAGQGTSQYLPIMPSDLENSGMDYVALGHIHAPAESRAGRSTAVYAGCPEPLDFGDRGDRGVYVVTVNEKAGAGERVSSEFVPMATRQMRALDVDITGLDTQERVRNAVLASGPLSTRKRDLWSVTLTGKVDPELVVDVPVLERELQTEFFFLRIRPDYRPAYDLDGLADPRNQSLEARFVRHMQGMRKDALDGADKAAADVAERALYYGLDALRQGQVLLREGGSR
jgi:DNA repair exonuclease SbcCD nuclease subunit